MKAIGPKTGISSSDYYEELLFFQREESRRCEEYLKALTDYYKTLALFAEIDERERGLGV